MPPSTNPIKTPGLTIKQTARAHELRDAIYFLDDFDHEEDDDGEG